MDRKTLTLITSLLALFVTCTTYGQKQVITSDLSYEPGWVISSDIDQIPGKVVAVPMVDSLKHLYIYTGNSPIDLVLVDSICFYEVTGTLKNGTIKVTKNITMVWSEQYQKWGIKITKFPGWIQIGYKDDKGAMVLSRRYRYAKKM
jgi:hypothetical protein